VIATFVDFSTAGRRIIHSPGRVPGHEPRVLYASSLDGESVVHEIHAEKDAIAIDAAPVPLGLVLHLPAWRADTLAKAGATS
jgi:hypothetical protein